MSPEKKAGKANLGPSWSVMGGEFDPETANINSTMISLMVPRFGHANPGSEGRRTLQSIELVLKAYELCGIDRQVVEEDVTKSAIALKEYAKQKPIIDEAPEFGALPGEYDIDIEKDIDTTTPSSVMNALRVLINVSNATEMIVVDDLIVRQGSEASSKEISDKWRWEVDNRTRRHAESIVRDFYRREFPRQAENESVE